MEEVKTSVAQQAFDDSNPDLENKWLTFWLDGQLFGSSIFHVEQIVSMIPITVVPEYPHYIKGIINIRGTIVPLIDLRLRLGKEEAAYTDHTCIIICRIGEDQIGFIADSVDAVVTIMPDQISPPPQIGDSATNRYLSGIARLAGEGGSPEKLVLCLDTTRVLLRDELEELTKK